MQALTSFAWSHNPGATLSFGDARWSLGFHNFDDCLSKFPECEGSIGAALKTLSGIYQSIADERAALERPSDCVFGIEVHPALTVAPTTPVTATGKTQMPGNVTGQQQDFLRR